MNFKFIFLNRHLATMNSFIGVSQTANASAPNLNKNVELDTSVFGLIQKGAETPIQITIYK